MAQAYRHCGVCRQPGALARLGCRSQAWHGRFSECPGSEKPLLRLHGDHSGVFPQVFYTRSLLHPSEDELPVSTTLTVRLSSKACWAPDEAARLTVMHRNGSVRQLVVTTFELKAMKSRDRVSILGKSPPCWPRSAHHQHHSVVFLGRVSVSLLNTCSSLPGV